MDWFQFNAGDVAVSFLSVLLEGIPFLLLGSLISGLVDAFVSPEQLARVLPKNRLAAVAASGLLGLIFPMCECGSVVVIRRFLRKGLPVGCAVTYMLGAPIVSPIVALSTWAAFRDQNALQMTTLRLVCGFALAVAVGLVFERFNPARLLQEGVFGEPNPGPGASRPRTGLRIAPLSTTDSSTTAAEPLTGANAGSSSRSLKAIYAASTDFLDVAVFFVIGSGITSVLGTSVQRAALEPLATHSLLSIVALMTMAAALALCSTTDAFIAATSFPSFAPMAKLAFLLFGPMVDLKLFWLYGLLFKRRTVALLCLGLFVVIGLLCWRLQEVGF